MNNKIKYVEALDVYTPSDGDVVLFLGGGISNCPDWQKFVFNYLNSYSGFEKFVILNPRRKNFPINNPLASISQIKWEFEHLKLSTMVMFWFPCETLCPITLFEYGKHLIGNKKLFVGCHEKYGRKIDLEVQTYLEQPHLLIRNYLEEMCDDVLNYLRSINRWGDKNGGPTPEWKSPLE